MAARCFLLSILVAFVLAAAGVAGAADETASFPCVPGQRRPPWMPPCSPPPPQPAECYTSLSGMLPCAGFLTDLGVTVPAPACCLGLRSLVAGAPICMCHVVNGDFDSLLPAPMLRLRMMELHHMCRVPFPRSTLRQCIRGPVPPMNPPAPATPPASPSSPPAASPPESPSTPPAASPPESPSTPPAASPPESPSTPPAPPAASPPESPATPPASPSSPPAASPPESPATPPAATPPAESP